MGRRRLVLFLDCRSRWSHVEEIAVPPFSDSFAKIARQRAPLSSQGVQHRLLEYPGIHRDRCHTRTPEQEATRTTHAVFSDAGESFLVLRESTTSNRTL